MIGVTIIILIITTYIIYYYFFTTNNNDKSIEIGELERNKIMEDIRLPIIEFDTMDPIVSNNQNVQDIAKIIYEPLLDIDKDYRIKLCLAEEWAKINETEYIIKIKENVKWQNNKDVTSEDVKYTVDKIKINSNSIYQFNIKHISNINTIDDKTLRITLDEEVPFFEYLLNFPIMCSEYNRKNPNDELTSTGMYYISQINESTIVLKANDNWWNIENISPITKTIKINLYNSVSDVYREFKNGNIDIFITSNIDTEDSMGFIGYNVKSYKSRQYDFIAINTKHEVLNQKEVRQSILYGIDKEAIIKEVYSNKYEVSDFSLDYGNYLYKDDINYAYNVNKAREILQQAGWSNINNEWKKKEKNKTLTLSFDLMVCNENENRVKVAEMVKEQLEEIGIQIDIININETQYHSYLENKNYDMILTGMTSSFSPDLTTYFGRDNMANYENEEINTILSDVKNISDENLLVEKYHRILENAKDDNPYIGLYYGTKKLIYSKNIVGNMNPTAYNIFYNIDTWYRKES